MLRYCLVCCVAAPFAMALFALAAEPDGSEARLKTMTQRAAELKTVYAADGDRDSPQLIRSPILRCNDPTREEEDGTLWLWADGKRPVACLCLFFIRDQWIYEHVSLTDEALEVKGRPAWSWTPQAGSRMWVRLADAVPATDAARQRAARAIARRVAASEFHSGQTYPLRLLERPLYSYSDADSGLIDGCMFAFANGTNPEVLMQLEARKTKDGLGWHAGFARLSSAGISVKLGDRELWSTDVVHAADPKQGYFSVSETDELK